MSHIVTLIFVSVSAGSAMIGAGRRIFERRRARRELRGRPQLEQHTSEGEVVRVTGVVRVLERTLVAPLSGAICGCALARDRRRLARAIRVDAAGVLRDGAVPARA